MTLFKTIIAAARALSALYERSVFSYRGASLRNRLNQEWASSTTHLRALKVGSVSMSFFSSPLGLMCGMKPLAFAVSSLPTYAASRQRFWAMSFVAGLAIRPFSSASRQTLSWRLAPVTTSDKGTPFSSTRRFRFVPFFSPVRRVGSDGLLCQRRFDVRSVGRLPDPADSMHFIVLSKAAPPKPLKEPGRSPVLELAVEGRRSKALL